MKIGFLFPSDFTVGSVFEKPMGGSESAVSYLAIELARMGHQVTLFSFGESVEEMHGVRHCPFHVEDGEVQFSDEIMEEDFDFFIIKNGLPELGVLLRENVPADAKIVFWTGHAPNQPAIRGLESQEVVAHFNAIVCLSKWHQSAMIEHFPLDPKRVFVKGLAISPFFENLFLNEQEFMAEKPSEPILAYTSTPFRGLDVLLELYPRLKKKAPNLVLEVYSSMKVYGVGEQGDEYKHLYDQAEKLEGVDYVGSLPQEKLVSRLKRCSVFSYPNTFPETFCVSAMEAMAAGMFPVIPHLGALPGTCLGYGSLVPMNGKGQLDKEAYLSALVQGVEQIQENQDLFLRKQFRQVVEVNQNHTWKVRAKEWESFLLAL